MITRVPKVHVTLFLSLMVLIPSGGCRIGYEVLEEQAVLVLGGASSGDGDVSGDGDSGGDGDWNEGSGGDSGTGGTVGSGGAIGTGGAPVGDIVVNSSLDPTEAGKTTLRDAIIAVQAAGQHQTITFEDGISSILMGTALPTLTVSTTIYGNDVHLDFGAQNGTPYCLVLQSGPVILDSMQFSNCPDTPVYISGGNGHIVRYSTFFEAGIEVVDGPTNVTVGPGNYFEGGYSYTVYVNSYGTRVIDNTFV